MTHRPIQFPIDPTYNDPDYQRTGISLIELHHIRARFYINSIGVPIRDEHRSGGFHHLSNIEIVALLLLKKEAFHNWTYNTYQLDYLRRNHTIVNVIYRCPVCQLPKGTYCNTARIRNNPDPYFANPSPNPFEPTDLSQPEEILPRDSISVCPTSPNRNQRPRKEKRRKNRQATPRSRTTNNTGRD